MPCAGTGSRARGDVPEELPKQYRMLAGLPLVLHTLQALATVTRLRGATVVVAPADRFWDAVDMPNASWWVTRCGGATRAESVANGLQALVGFGAAPHDWVLVHDAARCLVTADQVDALIDACLLDEVGGLLAQPLGDTLKVALDGRVEATLGRSDKWLAQTPQMFRMDLLGRALAAAGPDVTDESSAVEALGLRPRIVEGSARNFKVTWPGDFQLAEAVLLRRIEAAHPVDLRD